MAGPEMVTLKPASTTQAAYRSRYKPAGLAEPDGCSNQLAHLLRALLLSLLLLLLLLLLPLLPLLLRWRRAALSQQPHQLNLQQSDVPGVVGCLCSCPDGPLRC